MTLEESSIYVNLKELRSRLYTAQVRMTKANRIIYGTPLMEASGKAIATFVLAFKVQNKRLEYIEECIGNFAVLRTDLEDCSHKGIFQFRKRKGETPEDRVSSEEVEIFRLVGKIDSDMCKWWQSLVKGKTICDAKQ